MQINVLCNCHSFDLFLILCCCILHSVMWYWLHLQVICRTVSSATLSYCPGWCLATGWTALRGARIKCELLKMFYVQFSNAVYRIIYNYTYVLCIYVYITYNSSKITIYHYIINCINYITLHFPYIRNSDLVSPPWVWTAYCGSWSPEIFAYEVQLLHNSYYSADHSCTDCSSGTFGTKFFSQENS